MNTTEPKIKQPNPMYSALNPFSPMGMWWCANFGQKKQDPTVKRKFAKQYKDALIVNPRSVHEAASFFTKLAHDPKKKKKLPNTKSNEPNKMQSYGSQKVISSLYSG
jgi:hypothetical protein